MTTMLSWEMILLLPPLVRFFLGFILVLVVTGSSVLLFYWLGKGEEGEE